MGSDSVTSASVLSAPNSRDFGKKKRANRSAKLKQCKLDARREQWLSQCARKNKNCMEQPNTDRGKQRKERNCALENLETGEENNGSIHRESDTEYSSSNSPIIMNSNILIGSNSVTNFTGSSSSSSSGGCCSGSITEEEEVGDDGCSDDWEAVAEALADDDNLPNHCSESPRLHETTAITDPSCGITNGSGLDVETSRPNSVPQCRRSVPKDASVNSKAWRPDDACRPQTLPNLGKQHSFPNSDWRYGRGRVPCDCNSAISPPSSCPICCEDLDFTDTSFLPCLCGFRLCLFCHKRIMEEDGRCPGCRKPYEHDQVEAEACVHGGSIALRLARSCSMFARS